MSNQKATAGQDCVVKDHFSSHSIFQLVNPLIKIAFRQPDVDVLSPNRRGILAAPIRRTCRSARHCPAHAHRAGSAEFPSSDFHLGPRQLHRVQGKNPTNNPPQQHPMQRQVTARRMILVITQAYGCGGN